MSPPVTLLCILDGFGLNPNSQGNAVLAAKTPCFDKLWESAPRETLCTFGERVGLPEGQMGNSEVGHLNIGAGRVVEQWLVRIDRELREGVLKRSDTVQKLLRPNDGRVHVLGLYSRGGVHSHQDHIDQVIETCSEHFGKEVLVHLITDGRDTSPTAGLESVRHFRDRFSANKNVHIASLSGRFYAMDRDNRWERTAQAFNASFCGTPNTDLSCEAYVEKSYQDGITDEFILPTSFRESELRSEDVIIFCNFRADRMRQLVEAVGMETFEHFQRCAKANAPTQVLCFTGYDELYPFPVLFPAVVIRNHLGEVLSSHGIRQLRTAETEKYPHVTYFLNGGREEPYPLEERSLVPSPRDVKTYDFKPEMSAHEVKEIVVQAIRSEKYDCIIVNFANCDMVGHTGVFEAAVKAVETVDSCLAEILSVLSEKKGQALIVADHGNAEQLIDYNTGRPHTAHTTYPVPIIAVVPERRVTLVAGGALCDVAPTLLDLMNIPQPQEMTGISLLHG